VAHSEPTKAFPKWGPEMAMLKQNLSPKVIAGSDITRQKFHAEYPATSRKGHYSCSKMTTKIG